MQSGYINLIFSVVVFHSQYHHIAASPGPSLIELTPATSAAGRPSSRRTDVVALGQPQSKPYFGPLDLAAVLCSLACLAASIVVMTAGFRGPNRRHCIPNEHHVTLFEEARSNIPPYT